MDHPFTIGQEVEKFTGDYTGPGIVREIIDNLPDGRVRIVVGHVIQGGKNEFFHIYAPHLLRAKK